MTIKKYVLWCVYSFILVLQPVDAVDKSFLINEYKERFNKNPQKTAFQIMDEARLFITKASAFADPKTVYTNSDLTISPGSMKNLMEIDEVKEIKGNENAITNLS